ncbi:DUF2065 domain-containing protein [Chitinimonas sp. BJYL2]|uniref:DUF2065 domain-containing protein n=1 Tax=Chitinimonas sp. BJYL2 TaxID=2976696 RepID=UPI0022B2F4D8|nr:DUF2065 domain-containing protein [Chitinimonas sp. BJYL2]
MWDNVALAVALVLIAEGLLPFLSPRRWRQFAAQLSAMRDGQIRFVGLLLVVAGLTLLAIV